MGLSRSAAILLVILSPLLTAPASAQFPERGEGNGKHGRKRPRRTIETTAPVGSPLPIPGVPDPIRSITERAAIVVSESLNVSLAATTARTRNVEGNELTLDAGTAKGIRNWSTVTLTGGGPAWTGTVRQLSPDSVRLSAVDGQTSPAPSAGTPVHVRLELKTMALFPAETGGQLPAAFSRQLGAALSGAARARMGMAGVVVPDFPDSGEARASAAENGADLLLHLAATMEGGALILRATPDPVIGSNPTGIPGRNGPIMIRIALSRAEQAALSSASDGFDSSPPGCRFEAARDSIAGPLLDLLASRYSPGQVLAVFPDRIETWRFDGPAVTRSAQRRLEDVWPIAVPTRWPVATVLPVNSVYGKDKQEQKVVYALCSNQRPRYLNIELSRSAPESLALSVSAEPRDTLAASFGACFARVDRVKRPADYKLAPDMPATAVARVALSEVILGPARVPVPDESGRPRTQRVAVIYYDEASATLWASTPDTAYRVPGQFGDQIEDYRAGLMGPPAFLVTSTSAPGEDDHLEYWVFENGRLGRKWQGLTVAGSITTVQAGDLDGDLRDDILVGEVHKEGTAYRSRLYVMKSRPAAVGVAG